MKQRTFKIILFLSLTILCILSISSIFPKNNQISKDTKNNDIKTTVKYTTSSAVKAKTVSQPKTPALFRMMQNKYKLVPIPTYDGSYQLTHPKILYFKNGWNGYKYWMSMTPYPHEADIYENPSIVVSNDGSTWIVPKGLKNPVSGLPNDVKTGGHYSDSHIVMHGSTMELWYRYNPSLVNKQKKRLPNNTINIYYRRTSKDGIHWSKPQKLLKSKDGHLSLCINYEGGLYKTWYTSYKGILYYAQSRDAIKWSAPVRCLVPLPKGLKPYHQDIIKNGPKYYLLQTAERASDYTFQLFLLTSNDGIHFTNIKQIYPTNSKTLWKNISFYRSTLFIKDNRLNIYISLIIPHLNWYITKTAIPVP